MTHLESMIMWSHLKESRKKKSHPLDDLFDRPEWQGLYPFLKSIGYF